MATRRGNKSAYAKREPPRTSPHESNWRETIARGDGIETAYERVSRALPAKLSCKDLHAALAGLAMAFGEVAFAEAAVVLKSYNLNDGALKRQILTIIETYRGRSTDVAAELMDQFVPEAEIDQFDSETEIVRAKSEHDAARIATAVTGITGPQGASFEALADQVRKSHAGGRRPQSAAPAILSAWPSGDTGCRVKIAWRGTARRRNGELSMPPGAEPCSDGLFIVPDNMPWRRAIHNGHATVLERLPAAKP